jgi:hypothetical protein
MWILPVTPEYAGPEILGINAAQRIAAIKYPRSNPLGALIDKFSDPALGCFFDRLLSR